MCKHGTTENVFVSVPADLSASGIVTWKFAKIDECIAGLVDVLQQGGIEMRGSCCGHGKSYGNIQLQDGRALLILDGWDEYERINNDQE